jgi:hypothetical protein
VPVGFVNVDFDELHNLIGRLHSFDLKFTFFQQEVLTPEMNRQLVTAFRFSLKCLAKIAKRVGGHHR